VGSDKPMRRQDPATNMHMIIISGRNDDLQSANDVARFERSHDHRSNFHTLGCMPMQYAIMAIAKKAPIPSGE